MMGRIKTFFHSESEKKITMSQVMDSIPDITVSTVDSYQGQERDIIIISTVRSNQRKNVGFLQD